MLSNNYNGYGYSLSCHIRFFQSLKMNCECCNCRFRKIVFSANEDTQLHRSILCKDASLSLIRMLLKRENPNSRDGHYDTPLHLAAITGNYEIAKELIDAGAEVNTGNSFRNTPLHVAVIHQIRDVTELLLQSGADVNSGNELKNKPLHLAVKSPLYMKTEDGFKFHDKLIVEMLIQAGADVNCNNMFNETPLFRAIETGNFDVIKMLLIYGANVDICDTSLMSCLHVALLKFPPNQKIIEELIKCGANIYCKDKWFRTPLDMAVSRYLDDPSDELKTAKILIKISVLVHPKEPIYMCRIEEKIFHKLSEFHKVCSNAVYEMMAFWVIGNVSLYDFALRGINCRVFSNPNLVEKVYYEVLIGLLKGKCGIYSKIVESYFPETYLKKVLMNIRIVAKNETDQREIILLKDVVCLICDYFTRTDLLRLIQASFDVESNHFMRD